MSEATDVLIMIPTYNEAENIQLMYDQLADQGLSADILFIDDNSPDGTGELIDRIAAGAANVHALHRPGKLGVGSAHQHGIAWAYERGYRVLLTMDADFTHSPTRVAEFLAAPDDADVVIGTRYAQPGSLDGWYWYRKLLTHAAHWMTVVLLGMSYDASGAFRRYRLDRLDPGLFKMVRDTGYSFFWESLYILWINGHSVHEIPIELPVRTYGSSKMKLSDVINGVRRLCGMAGRRWFNRRSLLLKTNDSGAGLSRANSPDEWERYWASKAGKQKRGLYDVIARFYRLYIIKRNLKHHIDKNFPAGARLLHAGCGGGEVDDVVVESMHVTALDISANALANYRKLHGDAVETVQSDIEKIDIRDDSIDGVYNLGVMEHFSPEQITNILQEFRRILKPGGRVVLFWPPTYGLSVFALKLIHFVLNNILRKGIRLHPDEPSLIRSRRQARNYMASADLELVDYSFGIRDLFTYAVVVGEKRTPAPAATSATA